MKLCITGHDFSGKSTLLKELYKEEDNGKLSYIHLSYREPTDLDFYYKTLMFSNFIMDRCYLDELIYPEIFNREQNLTKEEAKFLYDASVKLGITTLIVECSDDEILKNRVNFRAGQEESEVLNNLYLLRDKYREVAKMFDIPILDTSNMTLEEEKEYVRKLLTK